MIDDVDTFSQALRSFQAGGIGFGALLALLDRELAAGVPPDVSPARVRLCYTQTMQISVLVVVGVLAASLHPAPAPADAPQAYEHLKSLAGEWEADLPGFGKLTSTVRLASNGKAIEEIIGTPADNELSVYTLNADGILLTHYCAMTPDGHQVRLQTPRLGSELNRLDFGFVGATNLHAEGAPHMQRMTLTVADQNHYSEHWVKTENGKETVFDLAFVRR